MSIERSLRFGDENGGHELAGHVFETGVIIDKKPSGGNVTLSIQCTPQCLRYIFEKGFVGVDGSSLTVGSINQHKNSFSVHLIPETLRRTHFGTKKNGDHINIEIDARNVVIVESIERLIVPLEQRLTALETKLMNRVNT